MRVTKHESDAYVSVSSDAEMVDLGGGPEVGGIRKCIKYPNCGEFHPLEYINGMAEAIERMGGKIYENTRAFKATVSLCQLHKKKLICWFKGLTMQA